MRDPISINTALPVVVVEAFENAVIGTYANESEATNAAKADNAKSSGDSEYLIAVVTGRVKLGDFTPSADTDAQRQYDENVELTAKLSAANARIETLQSQIETLQALVDSDNGRDAGPTKGGKK